MSLLQTAIMTVVIFFSQLLFAESKVQHVTVSVVQAQKILADNHQNDEFQLIDVRTAKEYSDGHIENSKQIDFYADSFDSELTKLDRNKVYMLYCRTGVRSSKTLAKMKKLGFTKVYNIEGGMLEWQRYQSTATKIN